LRHRKASRLLLKQGRNDGTLPVGSAGLPRTSATGPYCSGVRLAVRRSVGNGMAGRAAPAGAAIAFCSPCGRATMLRGSGAWYGSATALRGFRCLDKCLTRRRKRSWMYLRRCRMPRWNCFNPMSSPVYRQSMREEYSDRFPDVCINRCSIDQDRLRPGLPRTRAVKKPQYAAHQRAPGRLCRGSRQSGMPSAAASLTP
jgi:hypothetical protein